MKGTWRVYPSVQPGMKWAFDNGDPDTVTYATHAIINGHSEMKAAPALGPQRPEVWVEVEGEMEMNGTTVTFWGGIHMRQARL